MDLKENPLFTKLNEVIHDTAHEAEGGIETLAKQLKMKAQVLRNKVNQNNDQNKLTIYETIMLMKMTDDTRVLDEIAWLMGFQLRRIEPVSEVSLLSAIVNTSADHGRVHQTIEDAVLDQIISRREMNQISQEIHDAIDALQNLHSTIEQRYKNREPAV